MTRRKITPNVAVVAAVKRLTDAYGNGSQSALARFLGVKQIMVSRWGRGHPVSAHHAVLIEGKTMGAFRCYEFTPWLEPVILAAEARGRATGRAAA